MTHLQTVKKALRLELKTKLKNIPPIEKSIQSKAVAEKLLQHEKFQTSSRISIYLSRDIEINTYAILNEIFSKGKECFIPKYESNKPVMEMFKLHSMEDFDNLSLTAWNIKQPAINDVQRENAMETGGLDLMIVPGIGFTKDGHRIGNGKGYYDIYIKNYITILKKPLYTIALAFKEQIVASIPTSDHDIIIDEIIFPD